MIHKIKAGDEHSIHSPFLFDFYTQTISDHKHFCDFDALKRIRTDMLKDHSVINIVDYGAGSKKNVSLQRKVSDIVRHSNKNEFIAKFLYRTINFLQPQISLELGTSLGLSTLYLHHANPTQKLYTVEGCPETFDFAKKLFDNLKVTGVESINGNIDRVLPELLLSIDHLDFVFFDANHTYEATLKYFNMCLSKITDQSVFVFDDIYWSEDMKRAWDEIVSCSQVMISVDFFYFGIVFFRKNQPKQHFRLKI